MTRFDRVTLAFSIALALAGCGRDAPAASNDAPVPNLSGLWAREYLGFDPPASGPGPIRNTARILTGQSDLKLAVGDYTSTILKPAAAEAVKERGVLSKAGKVLADPYNSCGPIQAPLIFYQQEFQLLQRKDEVVILYMHDHQ